MDGFFPRGAKARAIHPDLRDHHAAASSGSSSIVPLELSMTTSRTMISVVGITTPSRS